MNEENQIIKYWKWQRQLHIAMPNRSFCGDYCKCSNDGHNMRCVVMAFLRYIANSKQITNFGVDKYIMHTSLEIYKRDAITFLLTNGKK